jgi:hypothetical protein
MASADKTARVWAVQSDLAAGTVLSERDLRPVRVRLVDNASQYLGAGRSPAGQTLTRDVGEGELLPKDALTPKPCGNLVSVPVNAQHLPATVVKGQRIDVYATPKGSKVDGTKRVLHAVTVQLAQRPKGGLVSANAEWSIVVRVPEARTAEVVRAVRTADIDITVVEESVAAGKGECGLVEPSDNPGTTPNSAPGQKTTPGGKPRAGEKQTERAR